MKVLLFNPATPSGERFVREGRCMHQSDLWGTLWPPLSLATIAGALRQDRHQVSVIDAPARALSYDSLVRLLQEIRPDISLWSVATPTYASDLAYARELKELGSMTAVFGTHPSALAEQLIRSTPELDFIIRGEPEIPARELLKNLSHLVPGISFRDDRGGATHNPPPDLPDSLDYLPLPAWDLVEHSDYRLPFTNRPFLMMTPVRGCPYLCTFCTTPTYYGRKPRRMSVPRALEELLYINYSLGVRDVFFWSDTFTLDKGYVVELCEAMLGESLYIRWYCNSRVDTVDLELLKLMKRAGCRVISFGIESANLDVLKKVRKGITPEQTEKAVRDARQAGLTVVGHFIFGLPGETPQSAEQTIRFALDLPLHFAQFYCLAPFPGSALYEEIGEGLDLPYARIRQDTATLELPGLPPGEIERYRVRAYRRFYLRPIAFVRVFPLIASANVESLLRTLKYFAEWAFKRG